MNRIFGPSKKSEKEFADTRKPDADKSNETTIYDCFKWLYRCLFVIGCIDLKYIRDRDGPKRKTRFLSPRNIYLYSFRVLVISAFYGSFYIKLNDEQMAKAMFGKMTPVIKFILSFEILCRSVTYLQVVFVMDFYKGKYIEVIQRMEEIDEKILHYFPQVRWNFHKSQRKYTPFALFMLSFGVIVATIYVFHLAKCKCGYVSSVFMAISFSCISITPPLVVVLHVGCMDFIRLRYRLISRLLEKEHLKSETEHEQFTKICQLAECFKMYSELIAKVNTSFGYVSIVSGFHDFSSLTNLFYLLCQKATDPSTSPREFVFLFLLITPLLYKTTITGGYGYLAKKEGKKSFQKLQNLGYNCAREQNESFDSFLYWNTLSKYVFTIGRTIPCNMAYIYLVLNGVGNYVLILIQLQLQQNRIRNQMHHSKPSDISKDVEFIKQ